METHPEWVQSWSDEEVARHWLCLYPIERDDKGYPLPPSEDVIESLVSDSERIAKYRNRLRSLSWFMGKLNEWIARRANKESGTTGHFWEGRFKSQRLEEPGAVLTCMAYVDLNPIRSGVSETPEDSEFTSVQDRIVARQKKSRISEESLRQNTKVKCVEAKCPQQEEKVCLDKDSELLCDRDKQILQQKNEVAYARFNHPCVRAAKLYPLGEGDGGPEKPLHISLDCYLNLVDCVGRAIRGGKTYIPSDMAPILERLELNSERWLENVCNYGSLYNRIAGKAKSIAKAAKQGGQKWFQGCKSGMDLFREPKEAYS